MTRMLLNGLKYGILKVQKLTEDMKMNKVELVDVVASEAHLTKKDAQAAVDAMLLAMADSLARDEEVKLAGFGNFAVKTRAARKGVNPATGDAIEIPASKAIGFKAAKALKDKVN